MSSRSVGPRPPSLSRSSRAIAMGLIIVDLAGR
jgi:hypothetical protein